MYAKLQSVHIQNFQSIEEATLNLGRLTVLVGAGDVGKSAILRAIRTVFLNDAIDEDIRHGEKQCSVELLFDGQEHRGDGSVRLRWWKDRGKGGCYDLNGKTFLKTGGQVPEEVSGVLGIGSIEVDSTTTLYPQLSDQFDPPFLLHETGSKRARIIGKATRLDMIITAQMNCKKELDKAGRGATEATTALGNAVETLEGMPDYAGFEARLDTTEETLNLIEKSVLRATHIQDLADRFKEVQSRTTGVDVEALRTKLDNAAEVLVGAEGLLLKSAQAKELGKSTAELTEKITQLEERHVAGEKTLANVQAQLEKACEEAGVCLRCGGLLNHEECVA